MAGAARKPPTVRGLLSEARRRFAAARLHYGHGAFSAEEEARWLVAWALRVPFDDVDSHLDDVLPVRRRMQAQQVIEARAATRSPLAYLIHEAWLGEHRFYVDDRVLVPRSFIAEVLRDGLDPWIEPSRVRRALDLCTGSGCLAVLLALHFPRAQIDASDVSRDALAVARRNVRAYRLEKRIKLIRSDLLGGLAKSSRYDLIVANPPYVDSAAMARLPAEYRHEPRLALAGGADGLRYAKRIVRDAARYLNPGGVLVMEQGHHRREMERAFPRLPLTWLDTSAGDGVVSLATREELAGVRAAR